MWSEDREVHGTRAVTEALKSVFVIVLGIVLLGIACPPLWVFPLTLFEIRRHEPVAGRELTVEEVEEQTIRTERDWRRQRERAARRAARERAWLEFEEWTTAAR